MNNIISRQIINPEILFPEFDNENGRFIRNINYDHFYYLINRWKIILIEKYQAQPGQTICLTAGPDIAYYALFFAAAELGLVFIVDWPHVFNESDLADSKVTFHGKIDYIYIHPKHHDLESSHAVNYWEIQRNLQFGRNLILVDELWEYDIDRGNLYPRVADMIWATPESPLIYSTTRLLKKIVNSHRKVFLFAKRMANLYFTPNESVMHYKTIHHGTSMCLHFLPGFMVGGKQYSASGLYGDHISMAPMVQLCMNMKINNIFLYSADQLTYFLKKMPRAEHCINIVTLYQISPEIVKLVKEKNINWVKSVFGDTTIGVGFFIKTVNQCTDENNYDVTDMGQILDDFFKIELRDGSLYVACPELSEDWKTSDDKFDIINGNYHFRGRENTYRINGEWIQLAEIENQVRKLFGYTGANIVIDLEWQKIYLAIWEPNTDSEIELHQFFTEHYESVEISFVLRGENYRDFYDGGKIDNSKLRRVCREKVLE